MKIAETKVTSANLTTVPSAIREALHLEANDYIEWHIENDNVKVKKKATKETRR